MTGYRYPNEQVTLVITILVVLAAVVLAAGVTVCIAPLIAGIIILISYFLSQSQHRELIEKGLRVTPASAPELHALAKDCAARLQPGALDIIVAHSRQLNAYTFGLSKPRVIVLYDSLLQVMDADELRFILGHEMGHVALGHTWLNTLLGGMAGVPVTIGAAIIITFAFRWWNRACEFSADRAGLLACGSLGKATSALVKLVAPGVRSQAEFQRALAVIEAEDDDLTNVLANALSGHPMIVRRIEALKKYTATPEYRRLAGLAGKAQG